MRRLTLPTDSNVRKDIPLYSGCYTYFPAALAGVAMHSKAGNDKHNPGQPLHHSRGKSSDHADCIARHSMDIADFLAHRAVWTAEEEQAILTEANAMCWRALALSQELHEKFGAPLAPAARLPEDNRKEPQGDYLGRKIRPYPGRVHHQWCGLDADHTGECVANLAVPAPSAAPIDYSQPAETSRQSAHGAVERRTSMPGTVQASSDGKHYVPSDRGPL